MNLPNAALRRPITTFMVFIALIVIGLVAFSRLAIDMLPDIEFPSVTVSVGYPGASPHEVETLITEPMERAVSTAQNIEEVTSDSGEGSSSVRVEFTWGTDMTEAINDIRERVARVREELPEDIQEPRIFKFDTSAMPVMFLSLSGDQRSDFIRRYADDEIRHRLEQIEGVASVDVSGGLEREIQVNVDQSRLEAVGLTFGEVRSALRNENLDMPGGYVESERREYLVRTTGQFTSLSQIENTVVGYRDGVTIRLHQVAEVLDSFKEQRYDVRYQGQQAVSIMVRKQPGQNTVQVADRVIARIAAIQPTLPESMSLDVRWDTSQFIRDSINQIQQSAIWGGVLAIIILILFLRSARATMIIAVSIPIAVITTFILMDALGITLNMMSLGGIALGIGMLVDNAVVVLENIFRHRQEGKDAVEAAKLGAGEVSGAIMASTWTTLCVFLPMFFIGSGVQSIFFSQMAYTVSFALLASLLVALTLIPVLSTRLLKNDGNVGIKNGKQLRASRFDHFADRYRELLRWSLNHRVWVVTMCVVILAASVAVFPKLGSEFMPEVDEGDINVNIELPVGTKLAITDKVVREMEAIVEANVPELVSLRTTLGSSGG
ncbi:MAG: efflux RND transporter permease subunit, partial [Candidatus Poribacteria bacterium]|nr:efflux RND transporter permease subunit [Candidatus Poribacteria bacterium]